MYKDEVISSIADLTSSDGYKLNETKSLCTTDGTRTNKDISIHYTYDDTTKKITVSDLTKKGTKCFFYFDRIKDKVALVFAEENAFTSEVTKTSIKLTVSASDNKEITHYYFKIGSRSYIDNEATSNYTFTTVDETGNGGNFRLLLILFNFDDKLIKIF